MQIDRNKQRLSQFIDQAWNNANLAAIDEYVAPIYTIYHDPGDPWQGQSLDRAGFKQRLLQSRAAAPDQRFDLQDLIGEGNTVVATWKWRGTHLGQIADISPTGNAIQMSGLTAYYFEDDLLTGHWQVADRLGVYQQLAGGLSMDN